MDKRTGTGRETKHLNWFHREVQSHKQIGSQTKVKDMNTYKNVYNMIYWIYVNHGHADTKTQEP